MTEAGILTEGCYNRRNGLATRSELIWGSYYLYEALQSQGVFSRRPRQHHKTFLHRRGAMKRVGILRLRPWSAFADQFLRSG